MRFFLVVSGFAAFHSAAASCNGLAECDAGTDDQTSMLQLPAASQHDANHAELLALQQQVYRLSELEAEQLRLMGDYVAWATSDQLRNIAMLPQMLRDTEAVQGYHRAMTRGQTIGAQLQLSGVDAAAIPADSSSPVQGVRHFLQTYASPIMETTKLADDFPNDAILAHWCPGMELMAQHLSEMFQADGITSNANAMSILDGEHSDVSLLQGVDMKNLHTQKLSEEQSAALKQQLQVSLDALSTQEVFLRNIGASFVRFCIEDIADNCPPINYPILSTPLRKMVDQCVDIFGQVLALGDVAMEQN